MKIIIHIGKLCEIILLDKSLDGIGSANKNVIRKKKGKHYKWITKKKVQCTKCTKAGRIKQLESVRKKSIKRKG